jgi:large subunit ribosomal protein L21
MYAVIKTGGKQYRVQPGDLLVVEKLDGDVGAEIAFDQVLMLGDDGATHLGAPLVDGAVVRATLIETRKGDKVKIFKKIRRQGYRRTKGHRQIESVLRVTGLEGAGLSGKWDGEIDFTPLSTLRLRARGLDPVVVEAEPAPAAKKTSSKKTPKAEPETVIEAGIVDEQAAADAPVEAEAKAPAKKAAPKKTAADKAVDAGVVDEQAAAAEAPAKPKKTAAKKKASDEAASETE